MGVKEFFEPTRWKVVLALIIFIFLPVFPNLVQVMCQSKIGGFGGCSDYTQYSSLLAVVLSEYIYLKDLSFSYITIFGLIGAYVLSSIIIYSYNKISPETKRGIGENLKPTKGRLVISMFGWIAVGLLFMGYLSGIYRGTSNFTPLLNALYGIFSTLGLLLLPVTFFVKYVLFNLTVVLFALLGEFMGASVNLVGGYGLEPHYLNGSGALLVFPLLILEWYVVSCALVYTYNKIRGDMRRVNP